MKRVARIFGLMLLFSFGSAQAEVPAGAASLAKWGAGTVVGMLMGQWLQDRQFLLNHPMEVATQETLLLTIVPRFAGSDMEKRLGGAHRRWLVAACIQFLLTNYRELQVFARDPVGAIAHARSFRSVCAFLFKNQWPYFLDDMLAQR